jgi:hypothetical protein
MAFAPPGPWWKANSEKCLKSACYSAFFMESTFHNTVSKTLHSVKIGNVVLTFAHGARSSWALVAGMCGRARTRTRKGARYERAHATPPLSSVRCHR